MTPTIPGGFFPCNNQNSDSFPKPVPYSSQSGKQRLDSASFAGPDHLDPLSLRGTGWFVTGILIADTQQSGGKRLGAVKTVDTSFRHLPKGWGVLAMCFCCPWMITNQGQVFLMASHKQWLIYAILQIPAFRRVYFEEPGFAW